MQSRAYLLPAVCAPELEGLNRIITGVGGAENLVATDNEDTLTLLAYLLTENNDGVIGIPHNSC